MPDAAFIAQLVLTGLLVGATYALVAAGLALIFGVLGIVNFAHGEFYMLGGFAAVFVIGSLGAPYVVGMVAAAVIVAAVGLVLYEAFLYRLEVKLDFERSIIMMLGVSLVLQNGALVGFTAVPRIVTSDLGLASVPLGSLRFPALLLLAAAVAGVALVITFAILTRTKIGRAMRAISQSRAAAMMVGIRPRSTARAAFAMGAALAGVAGAALGTLYTVDPIMGAPLLFKSFAIITIGGLGSVTGATIAALLLGVTESLAGGLGSRVLQDTSAFLLMIGILLVRPQGLLGKRIRE